MKGWRIVLASGSPRRKELLAQAELEFVIPTLRDIDETFPSDMNAYDVPLFLAKVKADGYVNIIQEKDILLTADTVVILNNEILGKPKDRVEAISMLERLSGQEHEVVTGVALRTKQKEVEFSVTSKVQFGSLTRDQIEYYVDNYNPFDKAGGYGIQDWIGAVAVEAVQGSFYNVVGLPIQMVYKEIVKIVEE